jgi:hypothetical protein
MDVEAALVLSNGREIRPNIGRLDRLIFQR